MCLRTHNHIGKFYFLLLFFVLAFIHFSVIRAARREIRTCDMKHELKGRALRRTPMTATTTNHTHTNINIHMILMRSMFLHLLSQKGRRRLGERARGRIEWKTMKKNINKKLWNQRFVWFVFAVNNVALYLLKSRHNAFHTNFSD